MDVHPPKNGINRYWSIPISASCGMSDRSWYIGLFKRGVSIQQTNSWTMLKIITIIHHHTIGIVLYYYILLHIIITIVITIDILRCRVPWRHNFPFNHWDGMILMIPMIPSAQTPRSSWPPGPMLVWRLWNAPLGTTPWRMVPGASRWIQVPGTSARYNDKLWNCGTCWKDGATNFLRIYTSIVTKIQLKIPTWKGKTWKHHGNTNNIWPITLQGAAIQYPDSKKVAGWDPPALQNLEPSSGRPIRTCGRRNCEFLQWTLHQSNVKPGFINPSLSIVGMLGYQCYIIVNACRIMSLLWG